MNKLKNIDYNKYKLEDINYISYICTAVKKQKYKQDNTVPTDNDSLSHIDIFSTYNTIIELTTPEMMIPFGIETGSGFQMKLQFTNYKSDPNMKSFYDFISNLEFQQMQYIGLDENNVDLYNSQIYQDKQNKYDPNLKIKLPFNYNKFDTDIYSDNHPISSIMHVPKFAKMECDIYLDKIWKFNDKYISKWKVKVIHLV